MNVLARFLRRLVTVCRTGDAERRLRDEVQFHIERQTAEFVRGGMSPQEARAAALREFGGLEQSKEACRDARGVRLVQEVRQDLRYAGRMVRRHAGLTAVVMVTLGVGIGATTALFSVVADAVVSAIRAEIRQFDPELPLSHVTTQDAALERSMAPRLFNVVLLSVFGASALLLCVVGIYGIVSYAVTQRTREIGLRMTLGAQSGEVIRLVMGRGLQMVLAGVATGAIGALLLGRVLEGLLFGVRPRDPLTFVTVIMTLTIVAAVASYLPARRVTRLDLTAALRQD